ncbi:hypothetical protein OL548_14310 [Lysinibacillus sp. MHQ-1]|nr:hypothetical protein OL548_14310 [Lysinibacillus sp. MHQ-1]
MEIVNKERVVNLLRCLVQINTVNPPGNEKELASLLDVFVKDFGLETKNYRVIRKSIYYSHLLTR